MPGALERITKSGCPWQNTDMTETGFWAQKLRFHSYDVDFQRRAGLCSICRYFLDAAWNHAEQLGVGYTHLAGQERFWVLSRLLLKVNRFPQWGEEARLLTWPRQPKGVFALRDFELLDHSGTVCVAGVTAWLVLDAASHRPQRLDKLKWTLSHFPEKRATEREPDKLPEHPAVAESFKAVTRYSDLDVNNHVNSVTYLSWLLDSYPLEFHQRHHVKTLEVNYLGETGAGESVIVSAGSDSGRLFRHKIARSNGEEVCRARLEWEPEEIAS